MVDGALLLCGRSPYMRNCERKLLLIIIIISSSGSRSYMIRMERDVGREGERESVRVLAVAFDLRRMLSFIMLSFSISFD